MNVFKHETNSCLLVLVYLFSLYTYNLLYICIEHFDTQFFVYLFIHLSIYIYIDRQKIIYDLRLKMINLLDKTPNQICKFRAKSWAEITDDSLERTTQAAKSNLKVCL